MQYLDVAGFTTRTIMPAVDVDFLESTFPGFLDARLKVHSSRINARLAKRYAVPFFAPVPEIVCDWLVSLVTVDAYEKRGWDPGSAENADIAQSSTDAKAEMQEAADAVNGLYDLPLLDATGASAITKGGPLVYSEPGPYEWTDVQREAVRGR